jgi:2-(1,2-epoxy-1,2-dihydrophenyl)acetyl-CoA isomerase
MSATDLEILCEARGAATWITFNRPERRNAWTSRLLVRFVELLRDAERDPRARAVVVAGAGPVFCAGMDLNEAASFDTSDYRAYYERYEAARETLRWLQKPVIARVGGDAYGDGLCILECFDIIAATSGATFALREVNAGLHAGGLFFFDVGRARAMELSLTGRAFTATEAERWGLITRVARDEEELDEIIRSYVEIFAQLPAEALAVNKRSANLVAGAAGYEAARRVIRELSVLLYERPERADRMRDLLAKRRAGASPAAEAGGATTR